ncbi:uncharacterized protein RSE6_10992 [Rhynchosporium secalis]|uniref:BTB domain-containing protein n=1 Tax=Rhynchosporium secalis TaxID=38038 RepID=A0A1E1MLW2_RHYSE|nr:uncharacterized protein RSE6_10992 [Rhynchosporium secalis]
MVTFLVGHDHLPTPFFVHEHLVSAHSPFFKAALEDQIMDGTTQTIRVRSVDKESFGALVHWMYTEQIEPELGIYVNHDRDGFKFVDVVKVWKIAERALMPALQAAALGLMINKRFLANDHDVIYLANFIYETLAEQLTSKLRRFIHIYLTFDCAGDRYQDLVHRLPHHAVIDVSKSLSNVYKALDEHTTRTSNMAMDRLKITDCLLHPTAGILSIMENPSL